MRIRYLGHSAFHLIGPKNIVIDPFLSGNPMAAELNGEPDLILVTHAHGDHLGDAVELSKRYGAPIVCMYDIAQHLKGVHVYGMNYGPANIEGVDIVMVPAWHSSSINGQEIGNPAGYIVKMDGKTVYHAGDTFVFGDMALFNELYGPIDVALLPIGGYFTMGPREAAKAVELLKPKIVVPMHYNTFPPIRQDPEEFKRLVADKAEVRILKPGEELDI
jgi:L-ascorbate metabolism protein UlaG (beta-lactamase superfamily)